MNTIQDFHYTEIFNYIEQQKFPKTEKIEQTPSGDVKRIDVTHGKFSCVVKVYKTGTIQIQGQESTLKSNLTMAKSTIEAGGSILNPLPFDIEKFPENLSARIPNVDPVIVKFLEESIKCYKANSLLGCAFLLGAASEKAIWLLMDTFGDSIQNEDNKVKYFNRLGKSSISKAFIEFKKSFSATTVKPAGFDVFQDMDVKIEGVYQFCRMCRNSVGHPQIIPNLDKGVILANLGYFISYVEAIYALVEFYKHAEVVL